MATFGKIPPVGANNTNFPFAGGFYGCKFSLAEKGTVTSLSGYGFLIGNVNVKFGIFSDNAGAVNALLGQTASIPVLVGNQWYTEPLITPVLLTAGDYWLLMMGQVAINWFYDAGAVNQSVFGTATFADFSGMVINGYQNSDVSVYATYTAAIQVAINLIYSDI